MANETPAVLGSMFVGDFLQHASLTHYPLLRETLLRMITNDEEDARRGAARAICMSSFRFKEAEQDIQKVAAGERVRLIKHIKPASAINGNQTG